MNNIFDFKRFGNYFLYDLRNAKNNFALSLLICGTLPIILYVFTQLFSLIFTRQITELSLVPKYMQLGAAVFIIILGAGAKIYGNLTEKRAGSNYLMLPASTFEKWLSMGLIACVVLPVILLGLQLASDALMSFFFPNTYGDRILQLTPLQELKDNMADAGLKVNMEGSIFLSWCESILVFVLGAICFKKGKVGKTILCLFAFSTILSILAMVFFGHRGADYIGFFDNMDDPTKAVSALNWFLNIYYVIVLGGLLGGIYYRLRTLKH